MNNMRRVSQVVFAASLTLLAGHSAMAAGLLDAYLAAQRNDPTLRAARFEREAGQLARPIARAGLLPNVSLSSSRSTNSGDRSLAPGLPRQPLDYRSAQDVLSLRQPLFNYESYVRYQQGGVQAEYSDAVFNRKEGELAVRLALAYFDLLLVGEKLAFSDAEVVSLTDQVKLAQRRNTAGEGTLTEIAESGARLAIAEASRADALDQMAVARRALEDMTGQPVAELWVLKKSFVPVSVVPDNVDDWIAQALDKSPEIIAQRKLLDSATLDVDRNRAGHMPRVDFVASLSKTDSESLNTLNQRASVRSLGVQLTVPLFAGFGVTAQTEQAVANRERAAAELDATTGKVQLEVRRWFLAARTGITKVQAYTRAVDASMVAVEGSRRGMSAGIRTNTDVLDAQRTLYSALRDRAQARYEFLTSTLRLKAAAGTLTNQDIAGTDLLLEPGIAASAR